MKTKIASNIRIYKEISQSKNKMKLKRLSADVENSLVHTNRTSAKVSPHRLYKDNANDLQINAYIRKKRSKLHSSNSHSRIPIKQFEVMFDVNNTSKTTRILEQTIHSKNNKSLGKINIKKDPIQYKRNREQQKAEVAEGNINIIKNVFFLICSLL